ncbi:glycosyltransferase family 8 protein, partial [Pectobacterium versatile]|uniref:glycosyltransferase family 8 protein n=3 Tax=Pectobacteriaceae TaxID=1903410 RepID=UPI002DD42999
MKNTPPINIAYCTDSNYIEYVAVSITSIIMNNLSNKINFHVFLYDIDQNDKDKIKSIGNNIEIYEFSKDEVEKYSQDFSIKHLNRAIYLRLAVPRILHKKISRLIYLDADTLCFSDIAEINNIDINHVVCAVVSDNTKEINRKNLERLGIISDLYFNSGFLYI